MDGNHGTVIILVGPKGCGKTYIGSLLEEKLDFVHFVRVELIFMKLKADHESLLDMMELTELCYHETAKEVQNILSSDEEGNNEESQQTQPQKVAVLEVTGVAPQLPGLLETLKARHTVKFVKVVAPLDVCLKRTKERDKSKQIPVSEERIHEINALASTVEYPWDMIIQNDPFQTDEEIQNLLGPIVKGVVVNNKRKVSHSTPVATNRVI